MPSYVVIHWSGISSSNILWLHSTSQSVLNFSSVEFSGNTAMLIAILVERPSSEDGFSQQLTESNIAFALGIPEPLAKSQHLWEELLNVLSLLPAEEGKGIGSCPDWLELLRNDVHIKQTGESPTSQPAGAPSLCQAIQITTWVHLYQCQVSVSFVELILCLFWSS